MNGAELSGLVGGSLCEVLVPLDGSNERSGAGWWSGGVGCGSWWYHSLSVPFLACLLAYLLSCWWRMLQILTFCLSPCFQTFLHTGGGFLLHFFSCPFGDLFFFFSFSYHHLHTGGGTSCIFFLVPFPDKTLKHILPVRLQFFGFGNASAPASLLPLNRDSQFLVGMY